MSRNARAEALLASLNAGARKVTSESRNENKQNKSRASRFDHIEKKSKKRSRVLCLTELAFPFDPRTGEETETANAENFYRPSSSTETAVATFKMLANDNPELKEFYELKAGVDNWDVSDLEEVNSTDMKVFSRYRKPVVFTQVVVDVEIPAMTGKDSVVQYLVNIDRDAETQEVVGEMHPLLKVNKLFNDRAWTARKEFEDNYRTGKEPKLNEKDLKEKRRSFYKDMAVSGEHPVNYALCIELPLDEQLNLNAQLKGLEDKDIKELFKLHKYSHNFRKAIDLFTNGTNIKNDLCTNFFEVDMICSDDTDKGALGLNTTFGKVDSSDSISKHDDYEAFNISLMNVLDSEEFAEEVDAQFKRSSFARKFGDEEEAMLYDALKSVFKLEDARVTDKVIIQNQEVITRAFGDAGMDRVISAMGEGQLPDALDEVEAKKAGDAYTLDKYSEEDNPAQGADINALLNKGANTEVLIEDEI